MKKLVLALSAVAALNGPALAADMAARPYTKAPAPVAVYNWTGFYVFGGGGGGLWSADSNAQSTGVGAFAFGPAGTAITRDQRLGGSGWFGTVGIGYDMQFSPKWVAGVFADGQFGDIRGSLGDPSLGIGAGGLEGQEKLRTSYAAGVRLGYLVAPNVLSYVNAGYSGSEWSGTSQRFLGSLAVAFNPGTQTTTPSFRRDGLFIGGGVEHNLDIFGISAPGWFMKTEYRSAYYDRASLPTTLVAGNAIAAAGPAGNAITFKPWVQTVSTSLVYRFNSGGSALAADMAVRPYAKAPAPVAVYNWTGFHIFGGGGGGLWNADSNVQSTGVVGFLGGFGPAGSALTRDQRMGGSGWFGTVGIGYDMQFSPKWVAGIFADGQFGDIRGSLEDNAALGTEGQEKLRTSYAAGVRLGYLVAPNVLSYVNAGYSGSEWSGTSQRLLNAANLALSPGTQATTPSFRRDGWFIGGGVENNLDLFGISAPGWFMKTEYRSAFYDRVSLPTTFVAGNAFGAPAGLVGVAATFKPWVQTISTSLVYRFNWGGAPIAAKY